MIFPRLRSLAFGITLPWQALKLALRNKTLLFLSILPTALTITLYVYGIQKLQHVAHQTLNAYLASWGLTPVGWQAVVLDIATRIVLLIASALTFVMASTLIASPFNDWLAERTERALGMAPPPVKGSRIAHQFRLMGIDLSKTLAAGGAALGALLLFWIPGVNVVAFLASLLLLSFQYVSYPQTRRSIRLGQGLVFLLRHPFSCVGFGLALSFLFSLPVVSGVILPLAVIGGTLLYHRSMLEVPFRLR